MKKQIVKKCTALLLAFFVFASSIMGSYVSVEASVIPAGIGALEVMQSIFMSLGFTYITTDMFTGDYTDGTGALQEVYDEVEKGFNYYMYKNENGEPPDPEEEDDLPYFNELVNTAIADGMLQYTYEQWDAVVMWFYEWFTPAYQLGRMIYEGAVIGSDSSPIPYLDLPENIVYGFPYSFEIDAGVYNLINQYADEGILDYIVAIVSRKSGADSYEGDDFLYLTYNGGNGCTLDDLTCWYVDGSKQFRIFNQQYEDGNIEESFIGERSFYNGNLVNSQDLDEYVYNADGSYNIWINPLLSIEWVYYDWDLGEYVKVAEHNSLTNIFTTDNIYCVSSFLTGMLPSDPPDAVTVPTPDQMQSFITRINPDVYPDVNPDVNPDTATDTVAGIVADFVANPNSVPNTEPAPDPEPAPNPDPLPDPEPAPGGDDTGTDKETPDEETPDKGVYTRDLSELFPFCIPFDLIHAFQILDAEPVAPVFRIPFHIVFRGRTLVNEEWIIDFNDYASVVSILRIMETLGFCVSLILVTRNLIKG